MIRSRSDVPANYEFHVESMGKSDFPGYDTVTVDFSADGKTSKPIPFLLSKDGKTLAQFTKFDISKDLRTLVPGSDNRPGRGGPVSAPVLIVGFDDLECPFCARMNAQLFPALLDRYKDQVRIVYRDFPLDQHPWALHAAVDTNCVGAQSNAGYWSLVDYIHAHADEIGGTEKTVAKANEMLDKLARDEGQRLGDAGAVHQRREDRGRAAARVCLPDDRRSAGGGGQDSSSRADDSANSGDTGQAGQLARVAHKEIEHDERVFVEVLHD